MTMAVTNDSLRQQLQAGADALVLGLTDAQITLLMDFLALLQKWNKVYNLTALRSSDEMLTHHLLDSLSVVLPLRAQLEASPDQLRAGPDFVLHGILDFIVDAYLPALPDDIRRGGDRAGDVGPLQRLGPGQGLQRPLGRDLIDQEPGAGLFD